MVTTVQYSSLGIGTWRLVSFRLRILALRQKENIHVLVFRANPLTFEYTKLNEDEEALCG